MADGLSYEDAVAQQPKPLSYEEAGGQAPQLGVLGYIGQQAKAGLTADLPTIAGKALQYTGQPGDTGYGVGSRLRAIGEENAAEVQPDESRGAVTRGVAGALRGAAPIVPLAVAGLAAQGTPVGPLLDLAGGAALAGGFGASQAQDTLEKARAAGLPEDEALRTARTTGGITGAGMGVVGALTGGLASPVLRNIAGTGAKTAADVIANEAAPGFVRPFLADTAGHLAGNVASMAAANAGTAAVEHAAGLPGPTVGEAALEGVTSGAALTAALMPFGAARTLLARRANIAATNTLQDAQADPQQRAEVAARIQKNLAGIDPEAAQNFSDHAEQAISNGQPLQLGQHLIEPPAQGQYAPAQASPQLALPAPVVRVDAQGQARMDGTEQPVADEPPAAVIGRTPVEVPQPAAPLALTAPVVTVDQQGRALTAADRMGQRGLRETGAIGLGRNADVTDVVPRTPSQAMGLDPAAGPMSAAAAIAVDSGAHQQAKDAAAQQLSGQVFPNQFSAVRAQKQARVEGEVVKTKDGWIVKTPEKPQEPTNAKEPATEAAAQPSAEAVPAPALAEAALPADRTGGGAAVPARDAGEPAPALTQPEAAPPPPTADQVAVAAHEAATSPLNDRAQPTTGQQEAGNYKLGHLDYQGLDVSIENPRGSTRSGTDPNGKPWSVDMSAHYGYIRKTTGADGDHVDAYVMPDPHPEAPVFVVDQHVPGAAFDEHKVVLGAPDEKTALATYDAHFSDGTGPERRQAVTAMSMPEFKTWLKEGDTTKPAAEAMRSEPSAVAPERAATNEPPAAGASAAAEPAKAPAPLSLGMTPAIAEPVTVRDGAIHIGKAPALDFNSGEPVKIADGATDAQIKQALKDAGAVSRRQKFFGGQPGEENVKAKGNTDAAPAGQGVPESSVRAGAVSPGVGEVPHAGGDGSGNAVLKAGVQPAAQPVAAPKFAGTRPSGYPVGGFHAIDEQGQPMRKSGAKAGDMPPRFPTAEKAAAFGAKQERKNAAAVEPAQKNIPFKKDAQPDRAAGETMRPTDIHAAVSKLTGSWLQKPDIHVLDSMEDAPTPVKAEWQRQNSQGGTGRIEGFHYRGGVYLMADVLSSPEAVQRVLYHEALGHFGLRGRYGDRLSPMLNQIVMQRNAEVRAKAEAYGLDMKKTGDRLMAAEEVLASLAQEHPELTVVQRAVAAIRTFLRENVPGFKDLALSDNEIIRNYILPARGFVERGRSAEPTFSRAAEPVGASKDVTEAQAAKPEGEGKTAPPAESTPAKGGATGQGADSALSAMLKKRQETPAFSRAGTMTAPSGVPERAREAAERFKATTAVRDASEALDGIKRAVMPQYRSDAAREVSRQMIEAMGHKELAGIRFRADLNRAVADTAKATTASAKARDLLQKGLTVAADKVFLRQSAEENYKFMQAVDVGDSKYFAGRNDLKGMADVISKMFNEKAKEVQALDTGAMATIRENYFPHVWKDEPTGDAAKQIYSTLGRRPLEGDKGFTKQRVFDDVNAGLAAGFEPVSHNPLDLVALKMQEMDKYILAHKTLASMVGTDGVQLIKAGEKAPPGYTDINGRYGSIERNGEKLRYVARDDIAQVIGNYLSPSLYHNRYVGKPFTAYMGVANSLNQFQLGVFSAFHAGFTSFEAVISHASIGLKALSNGDLKGAGKYLSEAPAAWINNPRLGSKIIQEMTSKGSHPEMAQIIQGLEMAGFKWQMDNRFQTDATKKMLDSWANGNKVGAALRSVNAVVEQSARPIVEWLVPRQKMGVFGEMYNKWIQDHPNATHEQLRNSAQAIWNRVDSRLGQVVYDRLFVNNVVKNLTQMLVRAPGWTGGTILEVVGGLKDLAKYAGSLATGKNPGLTDRAAYTLSLMMVTAISNSLLTAMFTGEAPEDWKDLVAFRTGNLDEHGRPERMQLPTYAKDLIAYSSAPGTTLLHKAHPLLSLIGDVARNRDYYGVEVRSPDDNIFQQLAETAGYAVKQFVPFWVRGVQKENERGGSAIASAAPLLGVMPAPADLSKTAAEKLTSQYVVDSMPQGTRTAEEKAKADMHRQMYVAIRKGDVEKAQEVFQQGRADGVLGLRDYTNAVRAARKDPLQAGFAHLNYEQATRVMAVASETEQAELQQAFNKKRIRYRQQHPQGAEATAE